MSDQEAHSEVEPTLSEEELTASVNRALQRRAAAQAEGKLNRGANERRAAELNQRKGRVNSKLLHGQGTYEPWTFRARLDLVKRVTKLAKKLSAPRAKVTITELMEDAMEMVLAKHEEGDA
jgi:hypothetical protein